MDLSRIGQSRSNITFWMWTLAASASAALADFRLRQAMPALLVRVAGWDTPKRFLYPGASSPQLRSNSPGCLPCRMSFWPGQSFAWG
jgi:hypothetical protein